MRVERLRLTDFRSYRELDLTLPAGLVVFYGRNAQGKSNLLEAISLIATTRSFRTNSEREAIRWGAPGRFARVVGDIARSRDHQEIEVILAEGVEDVAPAASASESAPAAMAAGGFRKRVRVNGAPRRAIDLVGTAPVVVFAPTDLDLVTGGPSQRRHFLDLTLCQTHHSYCRTLSQYQKVIAQRSALLKRIREGLDTPQSLAYWDDQLVRLALPIMRERADFLERASAAAARVYAALASDDEGAQSGDEAALRLEYRPSYQDTAAASDAESDAVDRATDRMRTALEAVRRREIAQGVNVLGPHRDDLGFLAGGVDLAIYGSRGQQRTVALALKLAELEYIEAETGEQPALLLDDVLSELDPQRREDLLAAVRGLDQTLVTTTDLTIAPASALRQATIYEVRGGAITKKPPMPEDVSGDAPGVGGSASDG
ncbi:MAG TPA: DNA replication/repair protein RecF [Ktedonobacterales bacterium]|jgi:DNA replication and repair protein RecF